MSDRDMDLLARKIVTLERQQNAAARATQLPASSVRLTDGTDYDLTQGLETAIDVQEDVVILNDYTNGISEHVDEVIDYTIDVPDWIQSTGEGSDASWEATQFAIDLAEAIGERVDTAQEAADNAAQAAADAQTTANGKNSRRRGQAQPPAPAAGWALGDQWIVDNAQGVPVELRVWNGTAFVREQTLASDLLVLGADGAVRISDGKITAPMISAGALDFKVAKGMEIFGGRIVGGEIFGGRIVGGEILLADYVQDERKWVHQCDTLTGVDTAIANNTLTLDTARKHSGTASVRVSAGGVGFTVAPTVTVNRVTAWVFSEVDTIVSIHAWQLSGFEAQEFPVKAGTWTEVTATSQEAAVPNKPVQYVTITSHNPAGTFPLWVDQVEARIVTTSTESGIRLFREQGGQSILESVNDRNRTRVTGGGIYFDRTDNPNYGLLSIGPWGIESSDSTSRLRISKSNSSPGVGLDLVAGNSPSNTAAISITGYGSSVSIGANEIVSSRTPKILWSGGIFMNGNQTASLSDTVANQLSGIVLVWSRYNGGAVNEMWFHHFVPKNHVEIPVPSGSRGVGMFMASNVTAAAPEMIGKYVYVYNNRIVGNDANSVAPNNRMVLRYVIGV